MMRETLTSPTPRHAPGPVLTVDLQALRANWQRLDVLSGRAATGAVVKANAYGLGMAPIARDLHMLGCTHFFTAYLHEGVALRSLLGPKPDIFIFNGVEDEDDLLACSACRLTPLLNTLQQVAAWSRYCATSPTAVMIDTGMNRLGLRESELPVAAKALSSTPVDWVMSHLASADEPDSGQNAAQLALFDRLSATWPRARRSFASTAGICLGKEYQLDLVRPGIGLYGGLTQGEFTPDAIASLEAPLKSVTQMDDPMPMSVGYGASAQSAPGKRIAVATIGYADGLHRALSNVGLASVGGVACPIIGRISMDLVMLDVTGVRDGPSPGDIATFFGTDVSIEEQADRAGTISYELLTSIGPRVTRRYVNALSEPGADLG